MECVRACVVGRASGRGRGGKFLRGFCRLKTSALPLCRFIDICICMYVYMCLFAFMFVCMYVCIHGQRRSDLK